MLTISNTKAHPSPKENYQCGRARVCDWTDSAVRVRSYCSAQNRCQLLPVASESNIHSIVQILIAVPYRLSRYIAIYYLCTIIYEPSRHNLKLEELYSYRAITRTTIKIIMEHATKGIPN